MKKSTLLFCVLGIFIIWAWIGTIISDISREVNIAEALEASGALFTALAFAAAGYAVWLQRSSIEMQRQELELQRQELKDTREELKGQKEQLELQNATLRSQSFASTFFNVLAMHREYSRDADKDEELLKILKTFSANKGRFLDMYNAFAERVEAGSVRHVIDLWYVIVRLIVNQTQLSHAEQGRYFGMFQAQVSEMECLRIALHIVGKNGSQEMKGIVENFGLLGGYRLRVVRDELVLLYRPSAFGNPV